MFILGISLVRSRKRINILEGGIEARGVYKECRNSFISIGNHALVYVFYTYNDNHKKRQEAHALVKSPDCAHKEVHIYYVDNGSVILEYLPGVPRKLAENTYAVNKHATIFKYILYFFLAIGFLLVSLMK